MTEDPQEPPAPWSPWKIAVQILLAAAIVAWRVFSTPARAAASKGALDYLGFLWQDLGLILALYWIFCVLAAKTRAWKPVTLLVVLLLFGAYSRHQFWYALDVLRHVL